MRSPTSFLGTTITQIYFQISRASPKRGLFILTGKQPPDLPGPASFAPSASERNPCKLPKLEMNPVLYIMCNTFVVTNLNSYRAYRVLSRGVSCILLLLSRRFDISEGLHCILLSACYELTKC